MAGNQVALLPRHVVQNVVLLVQDFSDLSDIPGAIQIVPRNLIEDLGNFPYPSDFAKYASSGVASFGANNLFYMRGERLTQIVQNAKKD